MKTLPPGQELVSFWGAEGVGLGEEGALGWVVAVVVEGKKGSEKGWDLPGVEDVVAAGGVLGDVVDCGGVDGAAFLVDGTVATVRMTVLDGTSVGVCEFVRVDMRVRSVRRQLVQSMTVEIEVVLARKGSRQQKVTDNHG